MNGNSKTGTATVTVKDEVKPTVITQNITVQLNASGSATITPAQINNGSTDNCSIPADGYSLDVSSFDCTDVGANTVTLTVTDVNGNSKTGTATVTVKDEVKPTVVTQNITVQLNALGSATITAAQINNGSTDNCSIPADGYSLDKTTFNCSNVGSKTVTLTVTDVNGNSATGTATVTVEDKVKPTVVTQSITVQLDATGAASITAAQINNGSTDNCSIPEDGYSLDVSSFDCTDVGANTVTLTVTDVNGNSKTGTATVTVKDEVKPTVVTQNITVQLNALGSATITAAQINNGSTDNCSISTYGLSKTTFNCSNVGAITVSLTVTDVNGNSETGTATVMVQDNIAPNAICKNIEVYLEQNGTVTISASQVDNGSNDACGVSLSLNKTSFTTSNVGANSVLLTVSDPNGNSSTCTSVVTVKKRPTTLVYTGDGSEQYSDQQGLTAVLTDQITGNTLSSKTIRFDIGSQSTSAATNASGVASNNLILTQDPAPTYTVASSFAGDATYLLSSDSDPFDITQEDARAYYTGALFASTSGATSSTATVTLSATIKDITAVAGDPAYDAFSGDIRKATVSFIDRDNNTVLATVPVGLVSAGDLLTGTATANVSLSTGSGDSKQFTIGIRVNNYYTRNASDENTIVTVSKPLNDFITGGGYINLQSSAGQKAGTIGTKNNFGFNVKFNKKGTNLQGNINTIFRRREDDGILHVYQIKGNAMTSLSTNTSNAAAKTAVFNGKANMQDITNPLAPLSMGGNLTLQVTMTDRGEPGNKDDIGITVWNNDGGMLYSSNWNSTKTIDQVLGGGNIKVSGGNFSSGTSTTSIVGGIQKDVIHEQVVVNTFQVQALPNPSNTYFTIITRSNLNDPISVRVLDILGRVVGAKQNIAANGTLRIGSDYRPGTYFVEITQGNNSQVIQLIKTPN